MRKRRVAVPIERKTFDVAAVIAKEMKIPLSAVLTNWIEYAEYHVRRKRAAEGKFVPPLRP